VIKGQGEKEREREGLPVLAADFYVRPVLEYASHVWAPYLIKYINALIKVSSETFYEACPLSR